MISMLNNVQFLFEMLMSSYGQIITCDVLLDTFRSRDSFIVSVYVRQCVLIFLCGVSWVMLSHKGASQSSFLASFNQTCPLFALCNIAIPGAVTRIRLSLPPL